MANINNTLFTEAHKEELLTLIELCTKSIYKDCDTADGLDNTKTG